MSTAPAYLRPGLTLADLNPRQLAFVEAIERKHAEVRAHHDQELRALLPRRRSDNDLLPSLCLKLMVLRLLDLQAKRQNVVSVLHAFGVTDAEPWLEKARFQFGMTPKDIFRAEKATTPQLWEAVTKRCGLTGDEKPKSRASVELIRAEDAKTRKLDWLWYARLLRRATVLLEGPPEKGKSTLLCELAARESRGLSFPGETKGREPGNVVMLVAEDDLEATVKPRLIAAGADLTRVFFLVATRDERGDLVPFHLSDDCDRLRVKCREVEATLVEVDPLVTYMGSRNRKMVDTSNDMQVRKALTPFKDLLEDINAAGLAVRHYKKGRGVDAIEAGGGSIAFSGLARVLLAALEDPWNQDRYLFAVGKNNLVPKKKRPAFAYCIIPSEYDPEIGRIQWGDTVEVSAGEILQALAEKAATKKESPAAAAARVFLQKVLVPGEWIAVRALYEDAKGQGISIDVLKSAKHKLEVIETQKMKDGWYWRMPKEEDT